MKLATLADGTRDGRLVVVSHDAARAAPAAGIAATLQDAVERWSETEPVLRDLALAVEAGEAVGLIPFDPVAAMAPLPRAWQWLDGSAFASHSALIERAFGIAPVQRDWPLMYQGMSHRFLGPTEDAPFPSEADGIDFEGEFAVVTNDVPMGVREDDALPHIVLLVLVNDWSLRAIAPIEMKTGFGWIGAKPACSMAPLAVTPDVLGPLWQDGRVAARLLVDWNGMRFGAADGREMDPGFAGLIAHAARTRSLCAGTIIGSGTVSTEHYRNVGSSCIAERRGIEIVDEGEARTSFMRFGDTVCMEARDEDGASLFGAICQRIVEA